MAEVIYDKYKIRIDPDSRKVQGLRTGDIVRRQYIDYPNLIYSLMVVIDTGVDVIAGKDSHYFIGALIDGDEPLAGELLDFVRVTNLFDPSRSGALYLTASDSESPFMDVIDSLAYEQSLCYPMAENEFSYMHHIYKYGSYGSPWIKTCYTPSLLDVNRIFRIKRNGVNSEDAKYGLIQGLDAKIEHPQRLLISFKVRASKNINELPLVFGAKTVEKDAFFKIDVSKEWVYKLLIVTAEYPSTYQRFLDIELTQALNQNEDWIEFGELNIVRLSDIATFEKASKARIGKISGIIDPIFGVLDGYGAYFQNVYATKNINIAGTLTAGDENGFASTFYVGKIHKNVILNSVDCPFTGDITTVVGETPAGIGNSFRLNSTGALIVQSAEWASAHHKETYCFSFWAKSERFGKVKLLQNNYPVSIFNVEEVNEWKRFHFPVTINADNGQELTFEFDSGNIPIYLTGPQLEQGSKAGQYQPTDGKLSYVEDYGAWFSKGGIGGTIQNPLLKLNEDGSISSRDNSFVIKPDGTGFFANGRFTWTKDTIVLQDVTIRWEDLNEEAKENILNKSVEISGTSFFVFPDELDDFQVDPSEIILVATEKNFVSISRKWFYLDSNGDWKVLAGANDNYLTIKPDGHYWEERKVLTVKYSARFNLIDYENQFTVSKLFDGESTYSIYISSSNGNVFRNGIIETTLHAYVYRGGEDITSKIPEHNFRWIKCSNNEESDETFNNKDCRGKSLTITGDDVDYKAVFDCEVLISTK